MKKIILLFITVLLLFVSCSDPFLIPLSQYSFKTYDGDLISTKLDSDKKWTPRQDFASVVFNNQIWIFGGYDASARGKKDSYNEDIYKSSNGEDWELVTNDAPYKGRRGLAAVVVDDYIYISGGFYVDEETKERGYANDLWRTNDGINWEIVSENAPWQARSEHAMLSTNGTIYIFGGFSQIHNKGPQYYSDMWKYNIENNTWSEIEEASLPGGRASFAYCNVDGNFYIQGGSFLESTQSRTGSVDTSISNWSSLFKFDSNFENAGWQQLYKTPLNNCNRRSDHSLVYKDNKIWLFSGKSNSSFCFSHEDDTYSTLYFDLDENCWKMDSFGAPATPMYGYTNVIIDEKIYLLGGVSNYGPQNEVWTFVNREDN